MKSSITVSPVYTVYNICIHVRGMKTILHCNGRAGLTVISTYSNIKEDKSLPRMDYQDNITFTLKAIRTLPFTCIDCLLHIGSSDVVTCK